MTWSVETERLLLRKPVRNDLAAIFTGWASSLEATRYVGWARHVRREDAAAFLDFSDAEWAAKSVGPCIVELRETGEVIGSSGLALQEGASCAEVGYIFAPQRWGLGYATETTQAMVAWASRLGLEALHAPVHPSNPASMNVLRKCAFARQPAPVNVPFPNLDGGQNDAAVLFSRGLHDVVLAP